MDFVADNPFDGRKLRMLTVVDCYSRQSLAIHVGQRLTGEDVVQVLNHVVAQRGKPQTIKTDNAMVESFNGRLRQECLNEHWFMSLADAKSKIEAWRQHYNETRPHSALNWLSPNEFARSSPVNRATSSNFRVNRHCLQGNNMSLQLTRFAVFGLHGKYDIDIPIHDNRLILVGVNGLGKTTVVNLIYFLLTAQWGRLLETEFVSIAICLNGQNLEVSRQDIQSKSNLSERVDKVVARFAARLPFPTRVVQKVLTHPAYQSVLDLPPSARARAVRELSRDLEMPSSYVARLFDEIPRSMTEDLFESTKDTPAISELLSALKDAGNQQVIYLPTFRRIEQDLKSIFPNLEDDELRKLTSRSSNAFSPRNRGHVELVQFGMHDVETKIAEELEAIRERTRSQLTNLTASYLKDIISNRADAIETDLLRQMDDRLVIGVLDRVEENTLSHEDKREVKLAIDRIRSGGTAFEARDKYLAYFFSRLLEIYVSLAESEKNIRGLVTTCNRYLERKHLLYNEAAFTVEIVDVDKSSLSWKVLSSGEKQVASLFTHLYLSRGAEQIVIIDEPELSLSVQWQKSLLPDISDSAACKLLIAVTHSPFIYANKLDPYAADLSKFITFNPRAIQN